MSREPEIFKALERGDIKSVDALLAEEPALANARNARGDSLLLAAVYLGRRPMARKVADAGATIGLFEAAALGHEMRSRYALYADACPGRSYIHDGCTALHLTASIGHSASAPLLLHPGAGIHARAQSD